MNVIPILLTLCLLATTAGAAVIDRVVAVVDGRVIAESQVRNLMELQERLGGPERLGPAEALNALIDEVLVAKEAERLGVRPTEGEVDEALARIRARNQLTEAKFREAIESQGVAFATYRERVGTQILRTRLAEQVLRPRMSVDDEALREFYLKNVADYCEPESVRLVHIQVPGADGREEAESIRARLAAGAGVEEVRQQESANGRSVADMGTVLVENLSEEVRVALGDLPAGQVSPVVEMRGACHLFVVQERQDGRIMAFEEVRDRIREQYFRFKEEDLYRSWLESLRERARIEVKAQS